MGVNSPRMKLSDPKTVINRETFASVLDSRDKFARTCEGGRRFWRTVPFACHQRLAVGDLQPQPVVYRDRLTFFSEIDGFSQM